jgi:hypothetical protein
MNPRVVVSLLTSGQEFQQMQAADAQAAGKRLGLQVEVIFAESNAIQQIHQLYTYIHAPAEQRPLAIVVEAVRAEGMERLARKKAGASRSGRWPWTRERSAGSRRASSRHSYPKEVRFSCSRVRRTRRRQSSGGAAWKTP